MRIHRAYVDTSILGAARTGVCALQAGTEEEISRAPCRRGCELKLDAVFAAANRLLFGLDRIALILIGALAVMANAMTLAMLVPFSHTAINSPAASST
jgi:hypothetical protein